MSYLSRTAALVIDIRRNGGGSPEMVAAVCSYLMPPNTPINNFYWRSRDRGDEFRTPSGRRQAGGAHPGGMSRVTERIGVWVPSGRAVNPVSGTSWEGTGVRPDVLVPAEDALRTAHPRALEHLVGAERDPGRRPLLQQAIDELRRLPRPN
jgi:C-terminal processing protease CtpA/Prc